MYDRPYYYLTVGGTLVGGAEIWQTGIKFAADPAYSQQDLIDGLDAISVSDIFDDAGAVLQATGVGNRFGTGQALKWAKVAVIKTDGEYATAAKVAEGSITGTLAASNAAVPQLATVVSLWSGKNFGRAQRGRMYWPMPQDWITAVASGTGQVPVAQATYFRDLVAAFIDAAQGEIGTVVGAPVFPAIMSKLGTGTTNPVLEIGVGRVPDTQRRRRNKLDEGTIYSGI